MFYIIVMQIAELMVYKMNKAFRRVGFIYVRFMEWRNGDWWRLILMLNWPTIVHKLRDLNFTYSYTADTLLQVHYMWEGNICTSLASVVKRKV